MIFNSLILHRRFDGLSLLVSITFKLRWSASYNPNDYSTLQFLVSPSIGALSDKYGRKRILLLTMIGNILSALVCVLIFV